MQILAHLASDLPAIDALMRGERMARISRCGSRLRSRREMCMRRREIETIGGILGLVFGPMQALGAAGADQGVRGDRGKGPV